METEIQAIEKLPRPAIIESLVERDGLLCQYPGCGRILELDATEHLEVTIDHWMPKSWCLDQGWTWTEIWDLDNLKLMHKQCNAKKGSRIPNEDGSLPPRVERKFRYRRQKRAERPEICTSCNAGRNLGPDEVCASCNSGPQPERFPRWAKVNSSECDHELFWCAWCSIGVISRQPAANTALLQGESGEWK